MYTYRYTYINTSMYRYVCTCLHQPKTTAVARWQRWPKYAPHLELSDLKVWKSKRQKKDLDSMNVSQDIGTWMAITWELHMLRKHFVLTLDSTLRVQLHARAPLPKNSMTITSPSYDFMNLQPTDPTDLTVDWARRSLPCLLRPSQLNQAKRRLELHLLQRRLCTITSVASPLLSMSILCLNKHK